MEETAKSMLHRHVLGSLQLREASPPRSVRTTIMITARTAYYCIFFVKVPTIAIPNHDAGKRVTMHLYLRYHCTPR